MISYGCFDIRGFQSTLPVRGATPGNFSAKALAVISIHAPRTGSDHAVVVGPQGFVISIHAPRTGSDLVHFGGGFVGEVPISIHAPRTGSDFATRFVSAFVSYFNPRSPYGERLAVRAVLLAQQVFQSTLPVRGATGIVRRLTPLECISIHAPRTGSDSKNSQKVTLFLRQLNNFPKYHLGFPFLSRPTAFFSRKSVKKRSAKSPVFLVRLPFASKQSAHPQEHRRPSPQNARFCFHSGFQDSKTAGCPSPGP